MVGLSFFDASVDDTAASALCDAAMPNKSRYLHHFLPVKNS